MLVYISMTILAVFFSFLSNVKKYRENKIPLVNKFFWYISEIVLIIVSGIRYNVGQDYLYTYVPFFNKVLNGYKVPNMEIGFYYLNKIIQIFTHDYIWLFMICSIIFFHYIYKAIMDQSKYPSLSIFLLVGTTYIFIFYNAMRQMMAIAIFLYAIKYIQERNIKWFTIYMILACLFHYSIIILFPLYYLYDINVNSIKLTIATIIAIVIKPIAKIGLLKILNMTKYSIYINSKFDSGDTGYIVMLINVFVLLFALFFIRKAKKLSDSERKKYNFYVILQFVSAILAIYDGIIPLLNRMRWATGLSIIILIPFCISMIENKKAKLGITVAITLLYTTYSVYTIGVKNANSVLPYHTVVERG